MNLKIDKWYTFQEILDLSNYAPEYPHSVDNLANWFTDMIEDLDLGINIHGLDETFTSVIIKEIVDALMEVVYNRHDQDYFYHVVTDYPNEHQLSQSDLVKSMNKLINVIELTAPRYIPLFKQNEKHSKDPIARIGSKNTGRTRFNDTPQGQGDFNDSDHSTNVSYSINESEVDSGSIMSRLEELFKNFRSIILEWSNEFNQLFIKEEQIL